MEHAQKAAPEAKAQGDGGLRLEGQRGVIELELLQGVPQVGVFRAILGVHAAVHHGLYRAVAGQSLRSGPVCLGDGVAHPGVLHIFDGGGEVAHLTGGQLLRGLHAQGAEITHLQNRVPGAGGHELYLHARLDGALHHPEVDDDPQVGVVLAVEDERL